MPTHSISEFIQIDAIQPFSLVFSMLVKKMEKVWLNTLYFYSHLNYHY
ncbi:hypothetical protein RV10_GL004950 [Enterococcus pallens]|nr:hypothetical protein RV10_GL004950 [Enterococcus pallens]